MNLVHAADTLIQHARYNTILGMTWVRIEREYEDAMALIKQLTPALNASGWSRFHADATGVYMICDRSSRLQSP